MAVRLPRYTKEEFARRGDEIYERDIRSKVEADILGKFVAIDIETGAWEMDEDEMAAGDRLVAQLPDAQTWMVHIGYDYLRRFGSGRSRRIA
ncbi:MAG TPA: hypothetical protein VKT77_03325 [Chthonomonadaceae bacterium]|nr:hypothetical protein [Chthonomonadaceae bacterium]